MSTFRVPVESITVEPHPNADALEVATIQGYQSLVRKGAFKTGDLVAYIPEGIVVRPVDERTHPAVGRVIFKSVSADYLLRKNGTEYQ